MNKAYRIVWNHARKCLVVVQENARTRGKSGGAAGSLVEPSQASWCRALAILLMFVPGLYPALAAAQIIIDGRTATEVATQGAVTDVTTRTVHGANAFNSFQSFSVGQGHTANLHLPGGTANLINLVRDQRTTVDGILNSIKNGQIGGNVFFANPNGFLVSSSGVVNVGSLTLSTPTPAFVDGFFSAPNNPNDAAVGQLLSGTAPRNLGAQISIQGHVNAIDGVALSAGAIDVGGSVFSGARFVGPAPDFSAVVNANQIASASNVVVREGRIEIVADGDVTISGTLATPGGSGVRGGDIRIRAGGDVDLQAGAHIVARGNGLDSAGGNVDIWADDSAFARSGALVDASAGSSGDGGFIEFSARQSIELAGGQFVAKAPNGQLGTVLIDPINVNVSANFYSGGAHHTIIASENITVDPNVVVSTRNVVGGAAADQEAALSQGNSGNLRLEAPTIDLRSGSKLLAHANNGFTGGDVTLQATRHWTGLASISMDNATITGRNVALSASASYDDFLLTAWLPVVVPVTVASIDINAGRITASGSLSLKTDSLINVSSNPLSPLGIITAVSAAAIDVRGASVLAAAGNTTLASSSTVTSTAAPGGPNLVTLPGDAGVAINVVVSTAQTRVGGASSVTSGGSLDLTAKNTVNATTTADASADGALAIGGTLALSEVTSLTQAVIDGSATTSSSALNVAAESTSVVTTSAKAANKGAQKQTAAQKAAAPSKTEDALAKYKDQTTTAGGALDVAAAVAIANVNNITLAEITSTGTQSSTGAAIVSSEASTESTVTADGSSARGTVGIGAAAGANIGVLVNQARVGKDAKIVSNGLAISAAMPAAGKNSFITTATSGAGASNVGVAGALGTNVLVNTTVATLEGGGPGNVNLGGGKLSVASENVSNSTLTVMASVKPTSETEPAAVGVGASVGMNVGVNTTVAEIGNGAAVNNTGDVDLVARGDHVLTNAVTGGAAGADVSVTPVAAITVAVNTTTARLGTGSTPLSLTGAFRGRAEQTSSSSATATGQTQGNNVAVGASIAVNSATDTVVAEIDRDISATGDVAIGAQSISKSSALATASVAGGEKAAADGAPPSQPDGTAGKTVDEKVAAQSAAAKNVGKKTAESAGAQSPAAAGLAAAAASNDPDTKKAAEAAAAKSPSEAGRSAAAAASSDSKSKVEETKEAPNTADSTESGGIAVAGAVGVNVGVATTVAKVGKGRSIASSGGALKVTSVNETDTLAKADGSQVDPGNVDVGVGAAVALNAGISTNVAVVGDDAVVSTQGLTIGAVNVVGQTSDSVAEARSGAGAGNVGLAGSLAANVAINTTVAALEGDVNNNGTGASVNAGVGDILIEAENKTTGRVKSGAEVKGTGQAAKVGVGASLGMNVGVNTTVAEVADKTVLTGGRHLGLNARGDHVLTTDVTGGAAGAGVSATPLVAATVAVNTTTARLGSRDATGLSLTGKYSSTADHKGSATTTATGQTQGNDVAVGASIALTVATDTVVAEVERDVTATEGIEVNAKSVAKSGTSATASVAGGEKARADGTAPAPGGGAGAGQSVDQKVAGQQGRATAAGKATAAKAPVGPTPVVGKSAGARLEESKESQAAPKGETSEGGVAVAAAVGVNVGVATTVAKVGKGRSIASSGGALKVTSVNETDTLAKADGSQVDPGNVDVGVGAAVALNAGVATTMAVVADEATVSTKGLTIKATGISGEKSDSSAEARSGAGAGNVGLAGSLAINAVVNTTVALLEGDVDSDNTVTDVDAGGGAVLIEAQNATTSSAKVSAHVVGTGDSAKLGVGASIGVNVAVNTTVAEVDDETKLKNVGSVGLNARANHAMTIEATGGAAGAKTSITPVVAAGIAVNTTVARLGNSAATLDVSGAYSSKAEQTSTVTTRAAGQAQGDVAVGASLGATIAVDNVHASVERNLDAGNGIELAAKSDTSLTTEVKAGAKGARAAQKDADGNETPAAGTTVDEQKKTQLDFAKSRNSATKDNAAVKTTTPEAKTPNTTEQAPGTDKPTGEPAKENEGKKVSAAAAIGVTVAYNQARAEIVGGKTVGAGTGKLKVAAESDTNYRTLASGEAVSDDVGVAAAVALTGTYNKTQANIGSSVTVSDANAVEVSAASRQNRGAAFRRTMSAEAVSGAGGGEVAAAGSLALVGNWNETRASIDEGVTMGSVNAPVGDVTVKSDDTSKVSAQARAGVLSMDAKSKAGVGASFAVLLSYNHNTAAVGYDANRNGSYLPTTIWADSLTVSATKNRVWFEVPTLADAKNFVVNDIRDLNFDTLDPSTYLGSNNYYTEAVAGAAAKGKTAVAGAFAVNLFGNTTEAYIGEKVAVTASGRQPAGEQLGVDVAARSDTQAISFVGGVAGAKNIGVGLAATSIVSLDQILATIGKDSVVKSNLPGAGVKVSAQSRQDIANVGVAGGLSTEGVGVGGVLGAIVSLARTEAKIDDRAEVKSQGDIDVEATGDITAVSVAGGVAGGKNAGVGASIAGNVLANQTRAEIGDNAKVSARNTVNVAADADQVAVTAVVAGAGGEKAGVAGALSANVIVGSTEAVIRQGAQINTDAVYDGGAQNVNLTARDDSVIVGIAGGGAGGGQAGVGAALDTTVLIKSVKAHIEDDVDGANVARVNADQNVNIDARSTETIASVSMGFAGGGKAGVGGAVSIVVNKNDVQAGIGKFATVDSNGNVLINAENDTTAVLLAGAGAVGGTGVGGSLAVGTLLGSTRAYVGDNATANARGDAAPASVYVGETVIAVQSETPVNPGDLLAKKTESARGLSVTAYNRQNLITTVVGGAGGGKAGVAATVSANVIANTAEASIGRNAKINEHNAAANAAQQVRVKAINETLLVNTTGALAAGGKAGVGAAANIGVVAKTTNARIGRGALVNAKQAVELDAASSALTFSTTAGFGGGGAAGVGGAVAGVGVANTTQAYIEDATSAATAAKVTVTGGDLRLNANDLATSWMLTGAGAGGGKAGVGGSLSVGVNASTTKARIGNYAEINVSGTTEVHADSTENVNTMTVAGAGGGGAGVAGSIGLNVVVSKTEASIGDHAKVNQTLGGANQNVEVKATDRIITVGAAGAGAGGGAAGVGGSAVATVVLNTTSAYIGSGAKVNATRDVKVNASSEKYVNSAAVAGAGGGVAGVSGAISVLAVGSLLDGEARSGLKTQDENGNTVTTQSQADSQTTKSAVGDTLGTTEQAVAATAVLDANASKLAVSQHMAPTASVPLRNTQAFIGFGAEVDAGRDVTVAARDTTLAINANGAGAGGGVAGVAGSLGVTLLHSSAEAFIADGASVDADRTIAVKADTGETVVNLGVTGYGGAAAGVGASGAVNVVTSNTAAYIGDADINQGVTASTQRAVKVEANSQSNLIAVAGSGGGAGAAAVGGVLNVNTLVKNTTAFIDEGAEVEADTNVIVAADSNQNIVSAGISIQGAGAAAVGGVATVNVVANRTEAYIGSAHGDATKTAATVDSNGNVIVEASDDTLLIGVSGSGTGAGAAAVGGAVAANVISSQTRSYVGDNSVIHARGNAPGVQVAGGMVDQSNRGAGPALPAGVSGDIDADRDGANDGNVGAAASFSLPGAGGARTAIDPAAAKNSQGQSIGNAAGGLGTRSTELTTGLAVVATGNQKIISANIGIAGAGAAGVTATATANIIATQTEARIGDGAQINQSGSVDQYSDVRVLAADNSLIVMTSGTVAGAGIAAVSGSANTAVIAKQTRATVGDADIWAGDIAIQAVAEEEAYLVTTNVAVAGAGYGAAAGVAVLTNDTEASVASGASLDALGDIAVQATQDSALDIYSVAGAGGIGGASGAVSVGVIANRTRAFVADGNATKYATLDAGGHIGVGATSTQDISTGTVSAAGGGVGYAGALGVKVVTSETTAEIGDHARINQTRRAGYQQDVAVQAFDTVKLGGGGGAAAIGGFGAGATAEINVVRNTTSAAIGNDARVRADHDIEVLAQSTKDVDAVATALAGGAAAGIAGAVGLAFVGASIQSNSDASAGLGNGATAAHLDQTMRTDGVSAMLGNSQHVQGVRSIIASRSASLGVASQLNAAPAAAQDQTRAVVGRNSTLIAGRDVDITALDYTQINLVTVGAGGGAVGIGAAIGVGVTHSTTEALVDSSSTITANNIVSVSAFSDNIEDDGSQVISTAGAGGVVGASAAVAVLSDTSQTRARIADDVDVTSAGIPNIVGSGILNVTAGTDRKATTESWGGSVGSLAIGASVAVTRFDGSTSATLGQRVNVLASDSVSVLASDYSVASAKSRAGAAGVWAGSGAVATAAVTSAVNAAVGDDTDINASRSVWVTAINYTSTEAEAIGVNIGAGGAVGASVATATSGARVHATLGERVEIDSHTFRLSALRNLNHDAAFAPIPTARAHALGAAGGLLLGANATVATAESLGETLARVGSGSTFGASRPTAVEIQAENTSLQSASALGVTTGLLSVGASVAHANSDSTTQALLGDDVAIKGPRLVVSATGNDGNYALTRAGAGGVVTAPFSAAYTQNTSRTLASTGRGNATRKIDVGDFYLGAIQTSHFDSWINNTAASLFGVSGALAHNSVNANTQARLGAASWLEADDITLQVGNNITKGRPGAKIPGTQFDTPAWNVISSSGGLANVPAAQSTTTVQANALLEVGGNARLEQKGTSGGMRLDAWNDLDATDKVKMVSGGAVSTAIAKSSIMEDTPGLTNAMNARIAVLPASTLLSQGDLAMGVRSEADVHAQVAVDVFGAVGVAPYGESIARFKGDNSIDISAATLSTSGDLRLSAGSSSTDVLNRLDVVARTDVFNNTAIPVNRNPVADALIESHNQLTIRPGARLGAAGDAFLYADEGDVSALGVGVGKDIYREALGAVASAISTAFGGEEISFETRTGRSIEGVSSDVAVNGEVRVGTQRKQELVINLDGIVTSKIGDIDVTDRDLTSVAADIQARITELQRIIGEFRVDNPAADASVAVAAFESEINFLRRKLRDLGFATGEVATSPGFTQRMGAEQSVTGMTTLRTGNLTTRTNLETQNTNLAADNLSLQSQIDNLAPDDAGRIPLQNEITANNATIATNNTQIADLTTQIDSLTTQIAAVNADIAAGRYPNTPALGPTLPILTISDATARLGNIYVRGDRLHGSGTLDAPGDASIVIENRGPSFLRFGNLTIPAEQGGRLFMNGVSVQNNADINHLNGATGAAFTVTTAESAGSPAPTIRITSLYDPLIHTPPVGTPDVAPDMIFRGDIFNPRGLVRIHSEAGSVRLEQSANIRANDVEIVTRNGDFVQSYTNNFFHVAGAPLSVTPGNPNLTPVTNPDRFSRINQHPEVAGRGIVANGNVLIAARFLNINGIIQSGIPDWGVHVPAAAGVNIPGFMSNATFAQAIAHFNALSDTAKAQPNAGLFDVSNASVSGFTPPENGRWEQIRVRFNARENRLELSGVQVQGGYIELFGQIFNTNPHSSGGLADLAGGQLRVLDGYGRIKVDNRTQLPLWINTLDTGRGADGEIRISNITGLDAHSRPIITTHTYNRTAGAARTGTFFTPTANLRYAMSVGRKTGWTDNYRFSQVALFGFRAFPERLDNYWISRVTSEDAPIPAHGEFIGLLPGHSGPSASVTQTNNTPSDPVVTQSWFDCNWWTLCAVGTYFQEFSISTETRSVTTNSLKADHPVAIKFIGHDHGDVWVHSYGNIVMNGSITNRSGAPVSILTHNRIEQGNEIATITGATVNLIAGTGIGSETRPVQVNTAAAGGVLNATSSIAGDVRVKEMQGDLRVGNIGGANIGVVALEADRNIVNASAASVLQGQRVELLSNNGGIGMAGDALRVRTGYSADVSDWSGLGLKATARDDINIHNQTVSGNTTFNGNLLLIAAESKAGNVRIETDGSVIDNNPFATTDTRTEAQLAALWDDLRLRGTASVEKANEAVAAYQAGKNANYALYWRMRHSQANGGAVFNPELFEQLHAEVGGLTPTHDANFNYIVSPEMEAKIRQGATWSDAQLMLSVGAGLLKNVTDTVTTIKEPNVKGRSVTLITHGSGNNIGSYDAPQVIDLAAGLNALTTAQKAALAAAERGDATLANDIITVTRPRPVNVAVGNGALTATTAGYALIGSEQDVRINQITAGSDIRIKTAGSLINAAATGLVNVTGANVILEAANGGIGNGSSAFRVNALGDLTARAAQDIWIDVPVDLRVDTIYSPMDVSLFAQGSILDAHGVESTITPELNIRARNLNMSATLGSIGSPGNALDVGVNRDGFVTASTAPGQGIHLNSPLGAFFNVGRIDSGGAVALSSATGMTIDGLVSGPGPFTLTAGGTIWLTPDAHLHATASDLILRATSLKMQDAQRMQDEGEEVDPKYAAGDAARMQADAGTIDIETVGDARITGIETGNPTKDAIRVVSTAGRILDNGDTHLDIIADTGPDAKLTIDGKLGVGSDPLDVRTNNLLANSADGVVHLAVQGSINVIGVTAQDVQLNAQDNITGTTITSTGATGGVNVASATGLVDLGTVASVGTVDISAPISLQLGQVSASAGDVLLGSDGNIDLGNLTASNDVQLTTDGNINVISVTAGGDALLTAGGNVTGNAVSSLGFAIAGNPMTGVTITSATGLVDLDTVNSAHGVNISAPESVMVDQINVGTVLNLASDLIDANAVGTGAGPHGGSITGFGGGLASNINLSLSSPAAFRFSTVATMTGSIDVPQGALWGDSMYVGTRMTVTNPQTNLLIDQVSLSPQGYDVQLYTGGPPFILGLFGNHVVTNAFVVKRERTHGVLSVAGDDVLSTEEQADKLFIQHLALTEEAGVARAVDDVEFDDQALNIEFEDETDCPEGDPNCAAK